MAFDGVGGLINAGQNVLNSWWNIGSQLYNWKREDRYNSLTREREDNAIQRRVADLQAAGLSPVLAAGSAAASSSPINSSSHNVDGSIVGAYYDAAIAKERLKQEKDITFQQEAITSMLNRQSNRDKAAYLWEMGFSPEGIYDDGSVDGYYYVGNSYPYNQNFLASPFIRRLNMDLLKQEYNTDMTRKENNWYNVNQGLGFANTLFRGADTVFNGVKAFRKKPTFQFDISPSQSYNNYR